MWQQCPQCKGSGLEPIIGTYSSIPKCSVCNGHKIINQLTGLPPQTTNPLPDLGGAISTAPNSYSNGIDTIKI